VKELLFSVTKKDLKIDYWSGTGAGGQYRNKHQNCVRIHHPESGAIVTGQSYRERKANIKEALQNLVNHPKFKIWHVKVVREILDGKTVEEKVDEMLQDKYIKVEVKDEDDKWVIYNENNS
jgi:hypothetical protein